VQQGNNVVATGSETINLCALSFEFSRFDRADMTPNIGTEFTGSASLVADDFYGELTGPTSFGSGSEAFADSGSGDIVGISCALPQLDQRGVMGVTGGTTPGM
jgi:hypothetical protein